MKYILLLFFSCTLLLSAQTSSAQKARRAHPKPQPEPPKQEIDTTPKVDTTSFSKVDTAFTAADTVVRTKKFMTGADQVKSYLTLLRGKKVAVVANQTSMVGSRHLVDTLLKLKVNIVCVFTPEHGFRGEAAAGQSVESSSDAETN